VDLEHFRRCPPEQIPDDLATIAGPRIGFFGALEDYVVDVALLAETARRFPDANLVLIGDATRSFPEFDGLSNVHLLGRRPYAEIARYGSGFDVALMPWLQNDWIMACNPIKVKEYLALGLPVVTTWYPEVERYVEVLDVARSHEEFVAAVGRALSGQPVGDPQSRRAAVVGASWDVRTDELRRLGEKVP
jgi:glycosyltransferase involved in cell wall biosynthesis